LKRGGILTFEWREESELRHIFKPMSDFYSTPFHHSLPVRKHRRRKRRARAALSCGIIGWLGVLLSAALFLMARLYENDVERRFLFMAAVYLIGGLFCLVIQKALQHAAARLAEEGRLNTGVEPFDAPRRRHGGALILVLGVVAVVALLVAHAQMRAAMARRWNERGLQRARLQTAAAEAAFFALRQIASDEDLSCDHTNEAWCIRREWKDPAGISVHLQVTDENRFFDVNNLAAVPGEKMRAAADILADLMMLCGDFAPEGRLAALKDWMDADQDGAWESAFYAQKGLPVPANRVLYTWAEWLAVDGFDREYFKHRERMTMFEPFKADPLSVFTVLPRNRRQPMRVNINTASPAVLTGIVGLEHEAAVATLVAMRNKRPIRTVDELTWMAPDVLKTVRDYLDVRSRFFTIHAQAYANERIEAVFALAERTRDGQIVIRQWVMM
jgi:type II secretory pathway component PulK